MKKAVLILMGMFIATLFAGCSGQALPDGMHKFKLGEKMDIDGARVHFKLNKSGDSLFVHIHKPWAGDPEKDVQYEVSIYDKEQQLIQSIVQKSKRKYNNISHNFTMIDKSNVDRVAYFSVNISE
jgi:hypothetical protein